MTADLSLCIESLERQLLDFGTRSSAEVASQLLAADFREFGKSGRVFDRTTVIAALAAETISIDYRIGDFTLQLLGKDIALATYTITVLASENGASRSLRSSVWRLEQDGQWRMYFIRVRRQNDHASQIHPL
jgi:hypothetical protein